MIEVLQAIIAFIVALGLLVTFHEFGHFWVARKCNVKILRFSVGFGRPLYKRYFGEDRTEFIIAALPLGGYVKMLDENEAEVGENELSRAFNRKPLHQRTLIVLAGPVFNFIFAVCAYWLIFVIGIDGLKPIIAEVTSGSVAQKSGFRPGDQIISIDATTTPTWSSVIDMAVKKIVHGDRVVVNVINPYQVPRQLEVDLTAISIDDMGKGRLLETIGVSVYRPPIPPVMGKLIAGGAASRSGLQSGDKIIAVDGKSISSWQEWVDIIRLNPQIDLDIEVMRDNTPVNLLIRPDGVTDDNGRETGRIGAYVRYPEGLYDSLRAVEAYSLPQALYKGIITTWQMSLLTLKVLGKMLMGEASVKNLSGPISIAQYAGQSAEIGVLAFLRFLAIVSVSLGVLNLLPIPLLDGGHLLYYFTEFVLKRPVSEAIQLAGQKIGSVLLLSLMSLVLFNDIVRLMG